MAIATVKPRCIKQLWGDIIQLSYIFWKMMQMLQKVPVKDAAEKGATELLEVLLAKGANIHANSEAGTPLHCAAAHGEPEALKFLLGKNANVEKGEALVGSQHFCPDRENTSIRLAVESDPSDAGAIWRKVIVHYQMLYVV
ncbi:hypothetical protein M9H77_01371 [Catharanthus roseus]|uniref:Uncharacterized protein n=1 Tax=Catharanthus roseus TaxID=4058 RepID=A0ACC0C5P7_CATRO|nr:hypothetical protein M9H77_01371 [Catharanthus roseus]